MAIITCKKDCTVSRMSWMKLLLFALGGVLIVCTESTKSRVVFRRHGDRG